MRVIRLSQKGGSRPTKKALFDLKKNQGIIALDTIICPKRSFRECIIIVFAVYNLNRNLT